jgi:predicted ATPase/DNA-binding winged helix-turn-helix (wHTH) protein
VRYRFGAFELDVDTYELRRHGEPVPVEPQVFDVVAHLIAHRDRVVRKEELLDEVWGDRFVSESALTTRLKSARKALDDDGRAQAVIRTVHGRGYQFVADVVEAVEGAPANAARSAGGLRRVPLPMPAHPIYGRETELARLLQMLDEARVVTVVGAGGTGKTRLALEIARQGDAERDGLVVFAELAPVSEVAAVPDAIASAMGIEAGQHPDVLQACAELFGTGAHLLVLDNCEHVLDAAARVVERLVAACPSLRVLATSREPLGVGGEQVHRLDPLAVPDLDGVRPATDEPILALFAERARAVRPDFELDDTNLSSVLALCRSLDGLPLAIELAAGRLAALDVDDLRSRLDRRLDLIGVTRGTADERHRTLRATIDWSYDLLTGDERHLLRRLSVFPAGVSLETAEWVGEQLALAGDPALALSRLVEASMVVRVSSPDGARYVQLDTVRTFGLDRLDHEGELGEANALLTRWADLFAARAERGLSTTDEPRWDARVRLELPNLRAARAELLASGEIARVVALVGHLSEWSWLRPVAEFRRWQLELADQAEGADDALRQAALTIAAEASWLVGRLDEAEALVGEAESMGDPEPEVRSRLLHTRAAIALFRSDFRLAAQLWSDLYEWRGRVVDLGSAIISAAYAGDLEWARSLRAQADASVDGNEIPSHRAWIDYAAGELEAVSGSGRHEPLLEAAIAEAERAGSTFVSGVARVTLVSERARAGRVGDAAEGYLELIEQWLRGGNWTQQWVTLRNVAELLVDFDDRTALSLLVGADHDAFAPEITGPPAAAAAALRTDIIGRLGQSEAERIEAEARKLDRARHAEAAAAALAAFRESAS